MFSEPAVYVPSPSCLAVARGSSEHRAQTARRYECRVLYAGQRCGGRLLLTARHVIGTQLYCRLTRLDGHRLPGSLSVHGTPFASGRGETPNRPAARHRSPRAGESRAAGQSGQWSVSPPIRRSFGPGPPVFGHPALRPPRRRVRGRRAAPPRPSCRSSPPRRTRGPRAATPGVPVRSAVRRSTRADIDPLLETVTVWISPDRSGSATRP